MTKILNEIKVILSIDKRDYEKLNPQELQGGWSSLFAEYILENAYFKCSVTSNQLIECLIKADKEYTFKKVEETWVEFVSYYLLTHCFSKKNEDITRSNLSLYYFDGCPFCLRVLRVIQQVGADVEMRNILTSEEYREELVIHRGRRTVPVLRIQSETEDTWMPESEDIINYLYTNISGKNLLR